MFDKTEESAISIALLAHRLEKTGPISQTKSEGVNSISDILHQSIGI